MLNTTNLYYFSPTGGTLKVAETFCDAISESIEKIDLGECRKITETLSADLAIVAAPVFGGRIPELVIDRLKDVDGTGKKAVALVVYGVRAYEDALLELKDVLVEQGFEVIAAGAFIARHSIVPEVGAGRPDEQDMIEIREFAQKVLEKLEKGEAVEVGVPGNYPYKDRSKASATPITTFACAQCGRCVGVCPTDAIKIENNSVVTDVEKCILCMACVNVCPLHARMLPPQMQEAMEQKLGPLKTVRRENTLLC